MSPINRAGVRIGLTHNLPPELRPVPRGLPQPARATGYASPRLAAWVSRVVRRIFGGGR